MRGGIPAQPTLFSAFVQCMWVGDMPIVDPVDSALRNEQSDHAPCVDPKSA